MFPDYDPALAAAMQRETELFFENVMRKDTQRLRFSHGRLHLCERAAREILRPANNVTGEEFERVSLAGTPRRGVLTQASVLALTSNPTRTSPVKRGKWVLENLLGTPPPPPPPDVPAIWTTNRACSPARSASKWSSTAPIPPAPPATRAWTRLVSGWKILTPSARGATRKAQTR
jgi:hypothetical protein